MAGAPRGNGGLPRSRARLRPQRSDPQLLAQFYYADEELNQVAAELDSLDGRKDPQRCTLLVSQFRSCQVSRGREGAGGGAGAPPSRRPRLQVSRKTFLSVARGAGLLATRSFGLCLDEELFRCQFFSS